MHAPVKNIAIWFAVTVIGISSISFADSSATVRVQKVSVYEKPDGKSEVLTELKKGSAVTVHSTLGGWSQVTVKLGGGFTFKGWTPTQALSVGRIVASPPVMVSAPARPAPPVRPEIRTVGPSTSSTFSFSDRMSLALGAGYQMYQYKLSTGGTSPGSVFSYNLGGFGFGLDGDYWFWVPEHATYRAGSQIHFNYGMLNLSKLTVNVGTQSQSVKSKNTTMDFLVTFPFEYRFGYTRESSRVGLDVGMQYFKFKAKDPLSDSTGTALNLFITQSTMSFLGGAYGVIYFPTAPQYSVRLGGDVLFMNFVSESPSNATGTSPKGKLGFAPYVKFQWQWAEHQEAFFGYRMRMQDITFTGTASRVSTNNVTDGKAKTTDHDVSLGYTYRF